MDDAVTPPSEPSGAGPSSAGPSSVWPSSVWPVGRRGLKIAIGVLTAVVLVVVGVAAGALLPRFGMPGETSAEAGFARDMSEHHAQAVEMGMIAHQRASRPGLVTLGGDIALTQQAQIGMMQEWLRSWGLGPNSAQPPMAWIPGGEQALRGNLMPGMATREEIAQLQSATGQEFDILFCQLMLRHHQGGIHMVDKLLELDPSSEVAELAETMKRNQSLEIAVMTTMLTDMGAKPLS
jgi:uncharacterized protein (DUF305 family)